MPRSGARSAPTSGEVQVSRGGLVREYRTCSKLKVDSVDTRSRRRHEATARPERSWAVSFAQQGILQTSPSRGPASRIARPSSYFRLFPASSRFRVARPRFQIEFQTCSYTGATVRGSSIQAAKLSTHDTTFEVADPIFSGISASFSTMTSWTLCASHSDRLKPFDNVISRVQPMSRCRGIGLQCARIPEKEGDPTERTSAACQQPTSQPMSAWSLPKPSPAHMRTESARRHRA